MKVLVACEESQRVTLCFRARGHIAYSCDILPCSGTHPEWHIKGDALTILNAGHFVTESGKEQYIDKWDLIIAHPPCTYLTNTGNRWFNEAKYGERAVERKKLREEAAIFFMKFAEANVEHIAIENPIGYMSTYYRKPDQIIQPYEFGVRERKATCLWLKNLPLLMPTNIVEPIIVNLPSGKTMSKLHYDTFRLPKAERSRIRSKTFWGVARAMAEQWGEIL